MVLEQGSAAPSGQGIQQGDAARRPSMNLLDLLLSSAQVPPWANYPWLLLTFRAGIPDAVPTYAQLQPRDLSWEPRSWVVAPTLG